MPGGTSRPPPTLALCADHVPARGVTISEAGVRDIAAALGISKDTAARGLRCLIRSGIVRRETERDATGRFGRCRYLVTLPPGLTASIAGRISALPPTATMTASAPRPSVKSLVRLTTSAEAAT